MVQMLHGASASVVTMGETEINPDYGRLPLLRVRVARIFIFIYLCLFLITFIYYHI